MKKENIYLEPLEIKHLLGLLNERKEDGCYYGNKKYYYKRTDILLTKLENLYIK